MASLIGLWRKLAKKSPREIAQHAALRISELADTSSLSFPLLPQDVADSFDQRELHAAAHWPPPSTPRPKLGWLVVPPGPGSGGHTTLFRMMQACHVAGYDNTLLFYDRYHGDFARNVAVVRSSWPWLVCDIQNVGASLNGFDGIVASSWPTAHVAASRRVPGQPTTYFIQDFEPYFYPRGSEYSLAEDSYRLGLRNISLGHMVQDSLTRELGQTSDFVPFGCDTSVYRPLEPPPPRSGVLFYAKRGNDRRGYRLAVLALEKFHTMYPDEPIHVYGDVPAGLSFPVTAHGSLSPEELNVLYNSVVAGLALSFTNISLVAEEMLAAGAIPVIND